MIKKTRRSFVKAATATAVAAPLLNVLGVSRVLAQENDERKLGVALVGLGSLSTNQIAPALQKTKHCRLAGIVTGTPAKAEAWKSKYNLPDKNIYNYETMVRMSDNPDIDIVYVVTPNGLHGAHTIKAAEAGKHVLCEKPMEVSVKKGEEMIEACRKAKVQLAIGYRCQFEPHHLECMRLARAKVFGNLKIIEAGFGFRIGDPNQWRLKHDLAGGGALMDVGIYALQTTRYLMGEEPSVILAMESKTDPVKFKEVDETITWQMKFPSGGVAYCSTSYNVNGINRYTAYADRGWFGLDPAYSYRGLQGRRSDNQPLRFDPTDQFAAEMDDFALCVLNNQPTKVPGEEGLSDLKLLAAIYESIKKGREVKLG